MQLEFRKISPFRHALPLTDIHAHFEINRPVRYRNTAKRNYFHRRTDGQTSRTTTIGSFFEKRKKLLKNGKLKHVYQVI